MFEKRTSRTSDYPEHGSKILNYDRRNVKISEVEVVAIWKFRSCPLGCQSLGDVSDEVWHGSIQYIL